MKITDINGNPFVPLYGSHVVRPYTGFKSIDIFYCINNYEECENEADPEVADIDQNGDMNVWENMKISEETKALAKAMEEDEEEGEEDAVVIDIVDDDDGDDPMQGNE